MQWENIIERITELRTKFGQSFKSLNQNRPTKQETIEKHLDILFKNYNAIRAELHRNYERFTTQHKDEANNIFHTLRDKLIKILHKHNINTKVPLTLGCPVIREILETDEKEDFETDTEGNPEIIMPRTEDDILDKTTKIVPVFDGKVTELQSFLDALTLIDRIKDTHEEVAIEVIKTKLKGQARNLITNESTIQSIKTQLQTSIKGESSELLCSKLLNIKQGTKSATAYADEIQEIAKKLNGAYITEGYPQEIAVKLVRQNAAKAISRNASNDEVKLIIKTGNFSSLNEVICKFVESSTEASASKSSVFYFKRRGNNRPNGRSNNYRGRGQGWRQNNNPNNNRYGINNANGNNGRHGSQNNDFRNSQNRGRVRVTHEVSENEISPQNMGGNHQNQN